MCYWERLQRLCDWSSSASIVVGLEGHGRENISKAIDTTRTVGWFTNLYPVLLDVGFAINYDELIKEVKEQLRQIPDKGLGYGVLKYINLDETLQGIEPWDVVFNYLGQLDNVISESRWFKGVGEEFGAKVSEELVITEKLSVNALVRSGELKIKWSYSNKHFNEATVKEIALSYIRNLKGIINHCLEQKRLSVNVHTPSRLWIRERSNCKRIG